LSPELALRAVARALVLPPGGPLLLALAALLLLRRLPRLARALLAAALILLLALAMPLVANPLERAAEAYPLLDPTQLPDAPLIVVLGGGTRRDSADPAGPTPTAATLERLAYAARLARLSGRPLLLSGGSPSGAEPEALGMQRALLADFGLEARWLETRSRTTAENADETARLLAPLGIRRLLLVTSAAHMRRAVAEFRRAGLDPVPAPAGATRASPLGLGSLLPSAVAFERSCGALYELAGELVAHVAGRR
jgi:uncharacterized SAM-binding protein YcdF (DUF218 family)